MGHKAGVRLAQILPTARRRPRGNSAPITEQLGFRYFMFCGRFSSRAARRTKSGSIIFRFTGADIAPTVAGSPAGPLRQLALQGHPLPWRKIAARHGKAFVKASEFGLATGFLLGPRTRGQWSLTSFALARGGSAAERRILATLPIASSSPAPFTTRRRGSRGAGRLG